MPTLDQVNEVMDGLTMLDAHLQARISPRRTRALRLHPTAGQQTHCFRTVVALMALSRP